MFYGNNIFEIVLIISVIWIVIIILIVDYIHRRKMEDRNFTESKIQTVVAICAKGVLESHDDTFVKMVYNNKKYIYVEHRILKQFNIDSEIRGNELLVSL